MMPDRTFPCPRCKALVVVEFGEQVGAGYGTVGSADVARCPNPKCGWSTTNQVDINDRIEAHLRNPTEEK